MPIVPHSIIKDRWFKTLAQMECGELVFVTPEGDEVRHRGAQPGPTAHMSIADWSVLRNAAARGDIGLGEDYIDGAWDTDDIETLITYFLLNYERLDGYTDGNLLNRFVFVMLNTLVRRNSQAGSRRNIEAHYDVGNEFYALWLDETMTYSSALFPAPDATLAEAQRTKYGRILDRLEGAGPRTLEIGCGWGGFAEEAATRGREVTGLTISPSQYAFAKDRLGAKADIRLQDYRQTQGQFDSIVSIEMFEAVGERYWPRYFDTIAERLKSGGRALVQTITIRDDLFRHYRTRSDFIRHYVFPGGMLPSLARFREEAARAGLKVADVFSFGPHYAQTLRDWSTRMGAREAEILAQGRSPAFLRNWEFYLGMCAAAFAVGRTDVAQVELVRI